MAALVDQYGKPLESTGTARMREQYNAARNEVRNLRREVKKHIDAKYDAYATNEGNMKHWSNADHYSPDAANTLGVRRKLRSRSRFEIIENNPYLKGTLLTLSSDFVGSGPSIQITDKRFASQANEIEQDVHDWYQAIGLPHKLWQKKMAKVADGESFAFMYTDNSLDHMVKLNIQIYECDQVSSLGVLTELPSDKYNEVDGVRFDGHNNPISYYLLHRHPGQNFYMNLVKQTWGGDWVPAKYVLHWFRKDRPWMRGIPETAPSLPLCALLRRYTLAVVKAAELAAAFSAVLESNNPAQTTNQDPEDDDPFDIFPIEHGMVTTMPYATKLSQLKAEQPIQIYDKFVNALLREILRPLQVPFNIGSGSSQDATMSSAVVDAHIYRTAQGQERYHCEHNVLDKLFRAFWQEYALLKGYDPKVVPRHKYRWDPVGLDHTDPLKVAQALQIMHDKGFITDRDIQETRLNRSYEEWKTDIQAQQQFRRLLGTLEQPPPKDPNAPSPASGQKPAQKPNAKTAKKPKAKSK